MKSMPHLNDAQILDALDGRLEPVAAAHAEACPGCGARVDELRAVLRTIDAADRDAVPEPSPMFWEQFPERVGRAIDAEPERRGWVSTWLWWGSAATAALVILLTVLPLQRDPVAPSPAAPSGNVSVVGSEGPDTITAENLDEDEAWAMVRAVAEETDYNEVEESGLSPRAGSVERAALELNDDERAELVRLIEQDARLMKQQRMNRQTKRTGASLP